MPGPACIHNQLQSGEPIPVQIKIILASSSPYRKQLLDRLRLDYECHSPDVDESVHDGEAATDYVCRLAQAKARAIAKDYPEAIVIGSDQCALLDGQILGKPGSHEKALQQLRRAQGKTVVFHTGVCVLSQARDFCLVEDVPFEVEFRNLSDKQLTHYLQVEQPYDCAGSFKAEGYGACLFSALRGDDPNALIGLPLLKLTTMLESAGVDVV
ncbi:MAG: septum formation inhibitor Maf [Gammaproteobacteria bacterium]|nr:septum formation inhibitor Maf [Gammaproteobacteria bacterium]